MNHRTIVLLCLCSASALGLVVACGGDDSKTDGGDLDATTDTGGGSDTSTPDTSTNDSGNDAGSDASTGTCEAGTTCRQCCAALYTDAAAVVVEDIVSCACGDGGACNTQCGANLCKLKNPSPQCGVCVANPDAGDCAGKAYLKCAGSSSCAPFAQCLVACGDGG